MGVSLKNGYEIFTAFEAKKISTKEAFDYLNILLAGAPGPETADLMRYYNKILDYEFPETVVNSELDEAFWNSTHREDSDG